MSVKYSVVIPLKNEEENLLPLIQELEPIMDKLGASSWELICINDGSTDRTGPLLNALRKEKTYLKPLHFKKNYGQSSAFDAGFKAAQGSIIITLDGDRQNDPADIPKIVQAMQQADMVCGIRVKRKDTWIKKTTSRLANFVRSRLCQDGVQDTGCSLKAYRKEALQQLRLYEGMHRFLPALFKIEGFTVSEVPVNHRERIRGKSNYNFLNRSLNTVADMFAVLWMRKRKLQYEVLPDSENPLS